MAKKLSKERQAEQDEAEALQAQIRLTNHHATLDIEFQILDLMGEHLQIMQRRLDSVRESLSGGIFGMLKSISNRAIQEEQTTFFWARVVGLGMPQMYELDVFEERLKYYVEEETRRLLTCDYMISSTCPFTNGAEAGRAHGASYFIGEARRIIGLFQARRDAQQRLFQRAAMPAGLKNVGLSDRQIAYLLQDFLKSRPDLQ